MNPGAAFLQFVLAASAWAGPPVFDVHFAVITASTEALKAASDERLRAEVDILNRHFVSETGEPAARFRFKSAHLHDEVRGSSCAFAALGDTTAGYDSEGWAELFNACDDPKVRDPRAINFFVYDSHSKEEGFRDDAGHGKRNSNRPYVLIDWSRLGRRGQAPEEHEMGHAFGLEHVCAPGAEPSTSTNIMASAECGKGSGGRRDLGFTPEQMRTIRSYAAKITARLRAP